MPFCTLIKVTRNSTSVQGFSRILPAVTWTEQLTKAIFEGLAAGQGASYADPGRNALVFDTKRHTLEVSDSTIRKAVAKLRFEVAKEEVFGRGKAEWPCLPRPCPSMAERRTHFPECPKLPCTAGGNAVITTKEVCGQHQDCTWDGFICRDNEQVQEYCQGCTSSNIGFDYRNLFTTTGAGGPDVTAGGQCVSMCPRRAPDFTCDDQCSQEAPVDTEFLTPWRRNRGSKVSRGRLHCAEASFSNLYTKFYNAPSRVRGCS